jgi:two-component system NtrC family sensor kinase
MSVRYKITLGLLVILLASYVVLGLLTSTYVNRIFVREVQTRVRLDLTAADDIYNNYFEQIEKILMVSSIRRTSDGSLREEMGEELGVVFKNVYASSELDFLTFTDLEGNVIHRVHNPEATGDNISQIPLIGNVLNEWVPVSGTVILNEEILKNEGKDLQERAVVAVKSTPKARPTVKTAEKRGMVIASAVPINSLEGEKLGVIFGGLLINNNNDIVDQIKSKVFQDQMYNGKDIGTATVFFDDVRIATNVKQTDNTRAIGSRLSLEVYDHVIQNGKIWADRAFVVNDWYITAYEPILDIEGNIIGSLYVGLLEQPFKHPQKVILAFFIITLSITAVTSIFLMFFYTKIMIRPIDSIVRMSKEIMNGNLSARCNISPSGEMGLLCKTINQMAEAVEQHEKQMKEDTQRQILQSEKLASIGRLAAGVAHEINNPLTGVLTFSHLMKDRSKEEEDIKDLDVIIQETKRVREIVRNLLDFARQSTPDKEPINLNETIKQLLKLVLSQKEFRKIKIEETYDARLPDVLVDKNQIQQVFLNLLLNAGEAIDGEGKITISTEHSEESIQITISDSGCGIARENIDKIFDPFFTTKPVGQGTGLGLSISYGIIQQHHGVIKCESKIDSGTTFTVILPYTSDTR